MIDKKKNKYIYIFVCCITFSLLIVGATLAYFVAGVSDDNTVIGYTSSAPLSLYVERVTSIDMSFGLIPMYDDRAPFAARGMCKDDYDRAVCQIYKITVETTSDDPFFLDGFVTTNRRDGVETAFTSVYPVYDVADETTINHFETKENFDAVNDVKTGMILSDDISNLNLEDNADCVLVSNERIGGADNQTRIFYVMIWLHDNGISQDDIQGMEKAYTGAVTFVTAHGNEIKATFD